MTTTRSSRLFYGYGVGTSPVTVYTVPNGFTAIVKRVFTYNGGGNGSYLYLVTRPAGYPNDFFVRHVTPWSLGNVDEWDTWFAMETGDVLTIYTDIGQTNVIGYGSLLQT